MSAIYSLDSSSMFQTFIIYNILMFSIYVSNVFPKSKPFKCWLYIECPQYISSTLYRIFYCFLYICRMCKSNLKTYIVKYSWIPCSLFTYTLEIVRNTFPRQQLNVPNLRYIKYSSVSYMCQTYSKNLKRWNIRIHWMPCSLFT